MHAAQKLEREWIGIDVTHLAISLIEMRLNHPFPESPTRRTARRKISRAPGRWPYGKYPKIEIRTVAELLAGYKAQIALVDRSGFRCATKGDLSRTRQTKLL